MTRRYALEKLKAKEDSQCLEVWVRTKIHSDDLGSIQNFMAEGYRIYDTVLNKERARNVKSLPTEEE